MKIEKTTAHHHRQQADDLPQKKMIKPPPTPAATSGQSTAKKIEKITASPIKKGRGNRTENRWRGGNRTENRWRGGNRTENRWRGGNRTANGNIKNFAWSSTRIYDPQNPLKKRISFRTPQKIKLHDEKIRKILEKIF